MQTPPVIDAELRSVAVPLLFELSCHGLVWLDSTARVILMNSVARQLLARDDGIRLRDGRLRFRLGDTHRALDSYVARINRLGPAYLDRLMRRVDRTDGGTPYLLLAMPCASSMRGGALVLLVDLASRPRLDGQLCELAYGLTPAEMRVTARLLEGLTTPEIGQELSLSPLTVRTHIKRIFKKMGVRSQAQLMGALCQLAFVSPHYVGHATDDKATSTTRDMAQPVI